MRKYLRTLHTRSDNHKKGFAFVTSGVITLIIFAFWSLAHFGTSGEVVAENTQDEVSPLESLLSSVGTSFNALRGTANELKQGIETVNLEGEYQELRDGALNTYGRE